MRERGGEEQSHISPTDMGLMSVLAQCETRTLWVLDFAPGSCAASWRRVRPPSGRQQTLHFFSHPPARDVRLCCGVLCGAVLGEEHASRRPWYDHVSLAVCLRWCELCLGPTEVEVPPCYLIMKMIDSDSHLR